MPEEPKQQETSANRARKEAFQKMFVKSEWNQSEAARRLHVSSNHVNQIVRGRGVPSPLLMAFFEKLLSEKVNPPTVLRDVLKMLESLPEERRDQAIRSIRAVAESYKPRKEK